MITDKELYDFCKGHYYSDVDEGDLWEPFELYDKETVEELIKDDVHVLRSFLEEKYGKT